MTIFDLAQRIKRLSGCPARSSSSRSHYADVELRIPNVEKARELLGWEPQVELDDGLERTIAWYRAKQTPHPPSPAGRRRRGARRGRRGARVGAADDGAEGRRVRGASSRAACEVEHAVAVSSGTAALHLAVLALGIGPGDEVLVPAYTFPATANVVALAGATAVLVDVDPETMNVDPDARSRRSRRGRRRSSPCTSSAGRRGSRSCPELPLIEDAAGALGARAARPPCGALGVLGCLSFHPRKIVTTGEGGAVTTDDDRRSPTRCASCATTAGAARRRRHARAGPQLPALRHPLRGRDPAAAPARRAARRARAASRPGTRSGSRDLPSCCRAPTTATATAGRRT